MAYVDGYVLPVPTKDRALYSAMAADIAIVFKDHGALKVVECWGDDVPDGKVTSFPMAVKCEAHETVVLSWIVWPDRATRDKGTKAAMEDQRMQAMRDVPVDGKRMIFGGFEPIVDL